jgi:hypothetical protein
MVHVSYKCHLNYIDQKVDEYLKELDENDNKEHGESKLKVNECLNQLEQRRQNILDLLIWTISD